MILEKISNSGKQGFSLCGMLPQANDHIDHKTEFHDSQSLREISLPFLKVVEIKEVFEGIDGKSKTFYFNECTH